MNKNEKKASPFKVLIIDDEYGMRAMIRWMLQQHFPEVQIEEADEGFVAGWKAHEIQPNLVILDLMLPGLDGYKVCQLIRSFEELKDTKILSMSGLQNPEVQSKILQFGANDFIGKPFEIEALQQKICTLLGLPQNNGQPKAA